MGVGETVPSWLLPYRGTLGRWDACIAHTPRWGVRGPRVRQP